MPARKKQTPEERLLRKVARNYQNSREQLGQLRVQCEVSNRFLGFPKTSDVLDDGRDLMFVDVMTYDAEDDVKKLCELIVDRTELLAALAQVKPKSFRPKHRPPEA